MDPNHRLVEPATSFYQCNMVFTVYDIFICHYLNSPIRWEGLPLRLSDKLFRISPIAYQICNGYNLKPVLFYKIHELWNSCHGSVIIHYLAYGPAGYNPAILKSTAASVCPARLRTPPSWAIKEKYVPALQNHRISLRDLKAPLLFLPFRRQKFRGGRNMVH